MQLCIFLWFTLWPIDRKLFFKNTEFLLYSQMEIKILRLHICHDPGRGVLRQNWYRVCARDKGRFFRARNLCKGYKKPTHSLKGSQNHGKWKLSLSKGHDFSKFWTSDKDDSFHNFTRVDLPDFHPFWILHLMESRFRVSEALPHRSP